MNTVYVIRYIQTYETPTQPQKLYWTSGGWSTHITDAHLYPSKKAAEYRQSQLMATKPEIIPVKLVEDE